MSYYSVEGNYPYVIVNGTGNKTMSLNSINTDGYFIFSNVLEDGLNNFNTSTGTFTATVKGLYKFEALLVCKNQSGFADKTMEWGFKITKNSVSTNRFTVDNPEYWSRMFNII